MHATYKIQPSMGSKIVGQQTDSIIPFILTSFSDMTQKKKGKLSFIAFILTKISE